MSQEKTTTEIAAVTPVKDEKGLREILRKSIKRIEDILPPHLRSHADYFINRAVLTVSQSKQKATLLRCTQLSFATCVVDAATNGLAIDGKLAYAIPFRNNDLNITECTLMIDYKGIVAVARRAGLVEDAYAREVRENDHFEWMERNGKQEYEFKKASGERGKIIGAYAVAKLPREGYRFEHMDMDELEKVRKKSKSPNSPAWKDWPERMYAKAPLKRALATFQDNPILAAVIDYDNREFDLEKPIEGRTSLDDITNQIESKAVGRIEEKGDPIDFAEELSGRQSREMETVSATSEMSEEDKAAAMALEREGA